MIRWEIKKIIKNKVSIIALILMVVLFIQAVFVNPMLETKNEYYDDEKGIYVIDNRAGEEIAQDKLNSKVSQIKEMKDIGGKTNVDKSAKEMSNISNEKLAKDSGEEYKDIIFYQVFESRVTFPLAMLLILAIIVTISSNLYTDEKLSNVSPIILSSTNKNKVLNSKLLTAVIVPVVVYGIYILMAFLITSVQYGLPINGGLQAYRISEISSLVKPFSINGYIVYEVGVLMLVLMVISVFASLFSFITENSVQCISSTLLFVAIGKLLTVLKFLPNKLVMILSQANFIDILMKQSSIAGNYLGNIDILSKSISISTVSILLITGVLISGISLNVYTFKKILTK